VFQQVTYATRPGSARPNEDLVVAGASGIAVLDGATAAPGVDSGCVHDVAWLVGRLGGALAAELSRDAPDPLAVVLERAIEATAAGHAPSCDLANPDSPSATVALVRVRERLEYLVLGDSPVVLSLAGGGVRVVSDDRLERLPGGRPYSVELVRRLRNAPGGFWVAAARPEAARQSVTGDLPARDVRGAGVFTDGVARLVDWYGWRWETVLGLLAGRGPDAVISAVRALESERGPVRGKRHDDATAAWGLLRRPAC
jgi:hypothetical protein